MFRSCLIPVGLFASLPGRRNISAARQSQVRASPRAVEQEPGTGAVESLRSPLLGSTRPGKPAGNSHEFKTLLHCGFQIVQYLCGWVLFCPFCSSISSSSLGSCNPSFPLCFGEGKDRERGGPRHGVLCCPGWPETRAVLCLCLLGANHSSCHLPPFSKERLSDGQRHQLLPPVGGFSFSSSILPPVFVHTRRKVGSMCALGDQKFNSVKHTC